MYGKFIYGIILASLTALICSCENSGSDIGTGPAGPKEPASLVLTTDLSAFIAPDDTRATDADDNTLRHVTLFLVEYQANKLVAYRNIYPNAPSSLQQYYDIDEDNGFVNETTGEVDPSLTSGKALKVTFDYNNPKHGLAEKLTRGTYVLLAVANYSESDQFGNSGISAQLAQLIAKFEEHRDTGLENFRQEFEEFYNLLLKIPVKTDNGGATYAPYVRPGNVSIPLSSTLTLNLISGLNRASAELRHTCARISIGVRNYSELPLIINDLEMSDNFTQSACYLFSRADRNDNYEAATEHYGKGAPITTDDNALTPFLPGTTITKDDGITTIFDGLIYESRDDSNNYIYTIDVSYDGADDFVSYSLKNDGQAITSLGAIDAQGPYFLIKRRDAESYLYVNDDKVYASTGSYTPQQILEQCSSARYYNYVWELVKSGSGYYLRNVQTEDYIETVKTAYNEYESSRLKTVQIDYADTFTISMNGTQFLFGSNYYMDRYGVYSYLNTRGTNNTLVVGWNGDGNWSQFTLYPVEQKRGLNARHNVVLKTIDKQSSVVSDVHEIQRNDYIRVLVDVSYNPDKGDFEFVVNNWATGGGDITFN